MAEYRVNEAGLAHARQLICFARPEGGAWALPRRTWTVDSRLTQHLSSPRHWRQLGGRMADFTATAISEGDHWVIDVPGVGTTEAGSVEDIEEMTLELVVAMTHAAREDVHIDLRIV